MNCIEKQLQYKRRVCTISVVILLGFALLYPYLWFRDESRWQEVQTWQKIPATVVSHKEVTTGSGRSRRTYSDITYRYEINQKTHFGYDSGLGGRNRLPGRFHKPGAKVYCYIHPETGESMLDYRKKLDWLWCILGMAFFGGFAVFSMVALIRQKEFDAHTVPPAFAARLQPLPKLPARFAVSGILRYKTMQEDPTVPGWIFLAKKNRGRRVLFLLIFGLPTLAFLLVAVFTGNWGLGILGLLYLIPLYFCLRSPQIFVLNTDSRSIYFTTFANRMFPAKKAVPFSDVQALYLVWLTKSASMGILIQTTRKNLVIASKDPQKLMLEAAQLAERIHPQLPIYDLIHREYRKEEQQGYILI